MSNRRCETTPSAQLRTRRLQARSAQMRTTGHHVSHTVPSDGPCWVTSMTPMHVNRTTHMNTPRENIRRTTPLDAAPPGVLGWGRHQHAPRVGPRLEGSRTEPHRGTNAEEPEVAWRPPPGRTSNANRTNEAVPFPRSHSWTVLQASHDASHAAHRSHVHTGHTGGRGEAVWHEHSVWWDAGVLLMGCKASRKFLFCSLHAPFFIRARRYFGCLRGR